MAPITVLKLPSFIDCLAVILLITSSSLRVGHCQRDATEQHPGSLFQAAGIPSEGSPPNEASSSESFSCAKAGYHADVSTGCQKYHHCGKLLDGTWRKITLSCPSDTSFDQPRLGCIPGHVQCGHLEVVSAAASVSSKGQNSPPQKIIPESVPTLIDDNNASSVDDGFVGKNKSGLASPPCPHSFGYFPDVESNCRRYYACVTLKKGTVYTHYFQCPGITRFDWKKMFCVKPQLAPPCSAFPEDDLRNQTAGVHSLSAGAKKGWNLTLSSDIPGEHMDRVIANYILSHVRPETRQHNGSLISSQYLTELHPMPMTTLAALKLIHVNIGSVTRDTGMLRQYADKYGRYGVYVGSVLMQHGKSAIGNITEYVNKTNLDTVSKYVNVNVAFEPLKKAYDSVRRVFLPGSHGTPEAGISAQDVKYLEKLGSINGSSEDTSVSSDSFSGFPKPTVSSARVTPVPSVSFARPTTTVRPKSGSHSTLSSRAPSSDQIVIRPASHVSRPFYKPAAVQTRPGYAAPVAPHKRPDTAQKVKLITAAPQPSKQRVSAPASERVTAAKVTKTSTQVPRFNKASLSFKKPPPQRPTTYHEEMARPNSAENDYAKFYAQLFEGLKRNDSPASHDLGQFPALSVSHNFGHFPGLSLRYGGYQQPGCCGPDHPTMAAEFDGMRYGQHWGPFSARFHASHFSDEWKK